MVVFPDWPDYGPFAAAFGPAGCLDWPESFGLGKLCDLYVCSKVTAQFSIRKPYDGSGEALCPGVSKIHDRRYRPQTFAPRRVNQDYYSRPALMAAAAAHGAMAALNRLNPLSNIRCSVAGYPPMAAFTASAPKISTGI